MRKPTIDFFIKNKITFELTQLTSGKEGIFINATDRQQVLEYCFKHKLLENYEYRQNYEKVLLIFK